MDLERDAPATTGDVPDAAGRTDRVVEPFFATDGVAGALSW